jgi:PAS domain S-box-containing protein
VSTGGVQQLITLPPAPDSARTARRFVGEVLQAARADAFVDTATLLTSELVTNGIVHAHTELQVLVEATDAWVRVEVVDGDPRLPLRREYDDNASTGRGLEMVELLADAFGVEALEQDGKRVWFRLGVTPGTPTAVDEPAEDRPAPVVDVELDNLPVALYTAWQQHAEALLREATLATFDADEPDGNGDYPLAGKALSALADAAGSIFALRDDDVTTTDVTMQIDGDAVPYFPILRELLAQATSMSEAGQLLVPPSLPEIAALRRWVCDEVARQSAGLPPTPWVDHDAEIDAPLQVSPQTLAEIRNATGCVLAVDASNRMIAVSERAAELLGYTSGELEGRRLVTIIPQRMRDKHIAAFTRYLLDGRSAILGREYATHALHRDGTEVPVTLIVERRTDPATRALFVARLVGN